MTWMHEAGYVGLAWVSVEKVDGVTICRRTSFRKLNFLSQPENMRPRERISNTRPQPLQGVLLPMQKVFGKRQNPMQQNRKP